MFAAQVATATTQRDGKGRNSKRPILSLFFSLFLAATFMQTAHSDTIASNLHLDDYAVNAVTSYTFQI